MTSLLAFLPNTSGGELLLLLVIGLLLFGRDLPAVGRKLGQTMAQLRRGLHEFKDQMARDADVAEVRKTVQDFKRAAELPRALHEPRRLLEGLTDEALATPLDQLHRLPEPPAPGEPPAARPAAPDAPTSSSSG